MLEMPLGARQRETAETKMNNHEMWSCNSITPRWGIPGGEFIVGIGGKGAENQFSRTWRGFASLQLLPGQGQLIPSIP